MCAKAGSYVCGGPLNPTQHTIHNEWMTDNMYLTIPTKLLLYVIFSGFQTWITKTGGELERAAAPLQGITYTLKHPSASVLYELVLSDRKTVPQIF